MAPDPLSYKNFEGSWSGIRPNFDTDPDPDKNDRQTKDPVPARCKTFDKNALFPRLMIKRLKPFCHRIGNPSLLTWGRLANSFWKRLHKLTTVIHTKAIV